MVLFCAQSALAIRNAHLHQEAHRLATVRERERLAREMHDSVGQYLGYVLIQTLVVKRLVTDQNSTEAINELTKMEVATRELSEDVRESILDLRTAVSEPGSLLFALREYARRFGQRYALRVDLDMPEADLFLDLIASVEFQIMRFVQEALANVRKHSGASSARVAL